MVNLSRRHRLNGAMGSGYNTKRILLKDLANCHGLARFQGFQVMPVAITSENKTTNIQGFLFQI